MSPPLSRAECQQRLELIFPHHLVADRKGAGAQAAAAVFVCLYVGAINGDNPIRPTTVLWMCDTAAVRTDIDERRSWYRATLRGRKQVEALIASWGATHTPWYADNSREPLRDEVFRLWSQLGAIRRDESKPTSSSVPIWSLAAPFAVLFNSDLVGDALSGGIATWQHEHLGTVGRARTEIARKREAAKHAVTVHLPGGDQRTLHPGDSSLILQGFIEIVAPRLLDEPAVLAISESARKVHLVDSDTLDRLGLQIKADRLLPDALLFDAGAGRFWFVEAVATGGEITEERRQGLLRWAEDRGIGPHTCRFVNAFMSRLDPIFRARVAHLAWGSLVWFLDEPDQVIRLEDLPERDAVPPAPGP